MGCGLKLIDLLIICLHEWSVPCPSKPLPRDTLFCDTFTYASASGILHAESDAVVSNSHAFIGAIIWGDEGGI